MNLFIKISRIIFVLVFMIFITGCAKLKWLDKRAGEIFFNVDSTNSEDSKGVEDNKKELISFKDLSKEQKEKIDKWLLDNNLNRYGDKIDIFYAGGTPLFNEVTGESIERFEYILKKIPGILENIK